MPYRHLDHTGDLAVEVTAGDRDELFAEALRAMTDCWTEVDAVRPERRRRLALEAPDDELLLVDWLSESLFLFESEQWVARGARVSITETTAGRRLEAEIEGETHDPSRHPHKVAIKAVTYHGLEVGPRATGWRARVIFDI